MIDILNHSKHLQEILAKGHFFAPEPYLVSAQGSSRLALLAHELVSEPGERMLHRLRQLEELLFPPQIFLSSGMVVNSAKCSICHAEYGECIHVVSRAYMGEICCRIIKEAVKLEEISIVKKPANKLCRVLFISVAGIDRDFMIWREK